MVPTPVGRPVLPAAVRTLAGMVEVGIERCFLVRFLLPGLLGIIRATSDGLVVIDGMTVGKARAAVQLADEVCTPNTTQFAINIGTFVFFIPKEELALGQFLTLGTGTKDWFKRIWVVASIPCFGADCHGSGREVLYLLQVEIEVFGDDGKFSHIFFLATWMAAYEVRDYLLLQIFFLVDAVKDTFELIEELERRLAHLIEHLVGSVLGRDLESTAHMATDELTGIIAGSLV